MELRQKWEWIWGVGAATGAAEMMNSGVGGAAPAGVAAAEMKNSTWWLGGGFGRRWHRDNDQYLTRWSGCRSRKRFWMLSAGSCHRAGVIQYEFLGSIGPHGQGIDEGLQRKHDWPAEQRARESCWESRYWGYREKVSVVEMRRCWRWNWYLQSRLFEKIRSNRRLILGLIRWSIFFDPMQQ